MEWKMNLVMDAVLNPPSMKVMVPTLAKNVMMLDGVLSAIMINVGSLTFVQHQNKRLNTEDRWNRIENFMLNSVSISMRKRERKEH
jgi:hypothetical protein